MAKRSFLDSIPMFYVTYPVARLTQRLETILRKKNPEFDWHAKGLSEFLNGAGKYGYNYRMGFHFQGSKQRKEYDNVVFFVPMECLIRKK